MKRDTRSEILKEAKKLFNERGFNDVSTRDIAEALGISKGNLTYHFKKKEDIMEAIILEGPERDRPSPPKSLHEMNEYFLHMQQVVEENAYYFWHRTQMAQLSQKIRTEQQRIFESNQGKLSEAFQTLHAAGMLREACYPEEYERVIDTLLLASNYWVPFCKVKEGYPRKVSFQRQAWSILHPLLTQAGRTEMQSFVDLQVSEG